jgi:hypothetical protein
VDLLFVQPCFSAAAIKTKSTQAAKKAIKAVKTPNMCSPSFGQVQAGIMEFGLAQKSILILGTIITTIIVMAIIIIITMTIMIDTAMQNKKAKEIEEALTLGLVVTTAVITAAAVDINHTNNSSTERNEQRIFLARSQQKKRAIDQIF